MLIFFSLYVKVYNPMPLKGSSFWHWVG